MKITKVLSQDHCYKVVDKDENLVALFFGVSTDNSMNISPV